MLLTDAKQTCDVKILKDGQMLNLLIEGIAAHDGHGQSKLCRAAIIDIGQQKRADKLAATNPALQSEITAPTGRDGIAQKANRDFASWLRQPSRASVLAETVSFAIATSNSPRSLVMIATTSLVAILPTWWRGIARCRESEHPGRM